MKPKINRAGNPHRSNGMDQCQTPAYALEPLLPYIPVTRVIWESACGNGNLIYSLRSMGYMVTGTDILEQDGYDFFHYQPDYWDIQITNPPYSVKYEWLQRSYELNKPFALLMPVEMIGAAKAQRMFKQYGYEIIYMDKRVNFCMPNKGYDGNGAQFPTAWYTWGLNIGIQNSFATITRKSDEDVVKDWWGRAWDQMKQASFA